MTSHELSELVYVTLHVPFVLQPEEGARAATELDTSHARLLFAIFFFSWKMLVYVCWTNSKYKAYQEKQVVSS